VPQAIKTTDTTAANITAANAKTALERAVGVLITR
jgi:hypothetical protein